MTYREIIFLSLSVVLLVNIVSSLPVKSSTQKPHEADDKDSPVLENVIEYERYLKEVVNALESDKEFRKKLDSASEADIRSGKIAQELELVDHSVRSKLDELKRTELDRLRNLARQYYELSNDIDRDHLKIAEHLDHTNAHTFEIEDLKKLILKTSQDLAEADRRRRQEFKEYELQKEFEKQEKLKSLDEQKRKEYEEELKKMQQKHDDHPKVHHPGSKDQLEEVWEKQDHMEGMDFDPKSFFMMHDLDGNNFWDESEVKALFVKELDKVYQQGGVPEDDLRERAEEMERMREHVFKEADTNKDGLISYQEFLDQTKREEFNRDPGWETVDHQQQYTHEEYLEFERRRHEEIQRLIAEGKLPPHPNYYPPPPANYQPHPNEIPHGYQQPHPGAPVQHYQQQQQQYQQLQQQQYHQQQQENYQHQQRMEHQYQQQQQQQQQQPPQQGHPNQASPQYQQQPVQNQGAHPNQVPPQTNQPQQPQQQQPQQQKSQQGQPNQAPPQYQQQQPQQQAQQQQQQQPPPQYNDHEVYAKVAEQQQQKIQNQQPQVQQVPAAQNFPVNNNPPPSPQQVNKPQVQQQQPNVQRV
jgi:hypothetical protein